MELVRIMVYAIGINRIVNKNIKEFPVTVKTRKIKKDNPPIHQVYLILTACFGKQSTKIQMQKNIIEHNRDSLTTDLGECPVKNHFGHLCFGRANRSFLLLRLVHHWT